MFGWYNGVVLVKIFVKKQFFNDKYPWEYSLEFGSLIDWRFFITYSLYIFNFYVFYVFYFIVLRQLISFAHRKLAFSDYSTRKYYLYTVMQNNFISTEPSINIGDMSVILGNISF